MRADNYVGSLSLISTVWIKKKWILVLFSGPPLKSRTNRLSKIETRLDKIQTEKNIK